MAKHRYQKGHKKAGGRKKGTPNRKDVVGKPLEDLLADGRTIQLPSMRELINKRLDRERRVDLVAELAEGVKMGVRRKDKTIMVYKCKPDLEAIKHLDMYDIGKPEPAPPTADEGYQRYLSFVASQLFTDLGDSE